MKYKCKLCALVLNDNPLNILFQSYFYFSKKMECDVVITNFFLDKIC